MSSLSISVISGTDLVSKDKNGLSDPFLILTPLDKAGKLKKENVLKTKVIKKTLNPKWQDETFSFAINENFGGVKVVCWDWDRIGKDFMGEFTLPLSELNKYTSVTTVDFPLHDRPDAKKKHSVSGHITLSIHCKNASIVDEPPPRPSTEGSRRSRMSRNKSSKRVSKLFNIDPSLILFDIPCNQTEPGSHRGGLVLTAEHLIFVHRKSSSQGLKLPWTEIKTIELVSDVLRVQSNASVCAFAGFTDPQAALADISKLHKSACGGRSSGLKEELERGDSQEDNEGEDEEDDDSYLEEMKNKRKSIRLNEAGVSTAGSIYLEFLNSSKTSTLTVKVVQCKDLDSKDKNGFSDPYCKVTVGSKSKKTKTIKKTLNPKFDEEFEFSLSNADQEITFSVWDWDRIGKNDFIGVTKVSIDSLPKDDWFKQVYNISPETDEEKKTRKRHERRQEKRLSKISKSKGSFSKVSQESISLQTDPLDDDSYESLEAAEQGDIMRREQARAQIKKENVLERKKQPAGVLKGPLRAAGQAIPSTAQLPDSMEVRAVLGAFFALLMCFVTYATFHYDL